MSADKTIAWLVAQGRDPLEVLLMEPPADVAAMLKLEAEGLWDRWITNELRRWPPEARQRLAELIDRRMAQPPAADREK